VAAVLERALAEDPAGRPASAAQFATELEQAAAEGYGEDWAGRGALAAALVAHGAIGAAAAGYAIAGSAGAAGTAGAAAAGGAGGGAAAAGAAGLGAAGSAGLGAVDAAGEVVAAASAGGAGATGGAVTAGGAVGLPASTVAVPTTGAAAGGAGAGSGGAGAAAGGAAASSGKVTALVNAGVAVVVGALVGIAAVIIDPQPAEADALLITPDRARVIFIQTMDEAWDNTFEHLSDDAEFNVEGLLEEDESLADAGLTEIGVGVPRDQYEYPAWFVAWAILPFDEGTASVFARFDRDSGDEPWLMTTFNWSVERLLPVALLDDEGWLAPTPEVAELLVDPESLPQQYHDWLVRVDENKELGSDEVLVLRNEDFGMLQQFTFEVPFYSGDNPSEVSYEYEMSVGEVVTDLIPLVDGTVHVTFTAIVTQTTYNTPNLRAGSCDNFSLVWENRDPPGDFQWLRQDLVISIDGWVPIVDAVPEPDDDPTPEPTPEPSPDQEGSDEEGSDEPPEELELEPVDPTNVVIEDWNFGYENRDGERC
jgi:hypothetical protein